MSEDLPLVVEVVDTPEHIERVLPIVETMVSEGLVTVEKVRVIKYAPGKQP
jgi:PII-like signaling protein